MRDNSVSVEFDPFGFSIKDPQSRKVLLRSDSAGDLYPLRSAAATTAHGFHVSVDLWHARLGHPGSPVLARILQSFDFDCTPTNKHSCTSCRVGKHVRKPFSASSTLSPYPFCLLHCDVWTSPVLSVSSYHYYLAMLDDFTHHVWTFPLKRKSDVVNTLITFHAYVRTQFSRPILAVQSDNGCEFDNAALRSFYTTHGIVMCLSCPYTSQQNGKAERILHTLDDSVHALLSSMSPCHCIFGPKPVRCPPSFLTDSLANPKH